MMTTTSQPRGLGQYLEHRGFAPSPENPAWLDLETGQQIVRVLHEPGETTLLYCLDARHCLYEAVFSPGTPDPLVTAAIEAAISLSLAPASAGRPKPATRRRPGAKGRGVARYDDR